MKLKFVIGVAASLFYSGMSAYAVVGAATPFTCYEGEAGTLGGGATVRTLMSPPSNSDSSPELEASGHAFAQLNATGQSVTFTNTTGHDITALNLRYSIPDAPTGGGITATLNLYVDGVFRQSISLNSTQTWCYQTNGSEHGWSHDPNYGKPHIFYDEYHFFIQSTPVATNSTITFQKDTNNTASFYWIDVVDMENPPPALTQPPNSLSILTYGAKADDPTFDSAPSIQNCINAAQSSSPKKTVWVPPGTYYLISRSSSLTANGITIAGAGMWYSTIYAKPTLPGTSANILLPTSCTVQDLCFDANARSGGSGDGNGGGLNVKGNNWVVNNVWVLHLGAGVWADGSNGTVKNTRTSCTWADGINLNNGNGAAGNNIGYSLVASNCFVRGSGDDALALNSGNNTGCLQMTNTTVINCTSVAPWWANNLGIYGGVNILVSNNLCMDSVGAFGLSIGQFGNSGLPTESGSVISNVVVRGGSYGFYNQAGVPAMNVGTTAAIKDVLVQGNVISNALFNAMGLELCGSNVTVQFNRIESPGRNGMNVPSGAVGSVILYSNTVNGLKNGMSVLVKNSSTFVVVTPTNAANFSSSSGTGTENCPEGGFNLGSIENGDWSAYASVNLTGANTFVARIASGGTGGNIEIRMDSATGTLIGTCPVSPTGSWQRYTNAYCKITGASGTHPIYLVYTGSSGTLFNVEYFGLYNAPPALTHRLVAGNTYSLRSLANNKYVTVDTNAGNVLIAKSTVIGTAEKFKIADAGSGNIALMSLVNTQYVCAEGGGANPLVANRASYGSWETFTEVDAGDGNIGLRPTVNSLYVRADNNGASPLIAKSTTIGAMESFALVAPPPIPTALTARADSGQVTLSWSASSGAAGYNIKRSNTNGGPYVVIANNVSGTAFTNTGLTNLVTYYYVISATNDAGESANSAQVSATPGVLSRSGWVASASSSDSGSPAANAIDGNISTRWSSGVNQANGQWFQVDMGSTNTFYQLILDAGTSTGDYPGSYRVNVSNDGSNWGNPIATGAGAVVTTITFAPQSARYIRVTQTGNSGPWWSIHEFNVYGTPGTPPATPTALAAIGGDGQVSLTWNASLGAVSYNIKRATAINGTYATVASNLTTLSYTNTALSNGTNYYFAVSASNPAGESSNSTPANARPVSMAVPQVSFTANAGQIILAWPPDHTSWSLQVQTNTLGTNWITLPTSQTTNIISLPIASGTNSVFYRLVSP